MDIVSIRQHKENKHKMKINNEQLIETTKLILENAILLLERRQQEENSDVVLPNLNEKGLPCIVIKEKLGRIKFTTVSSISAHQNSQGKIGLIIEGADNDRPIYWFTTSEINNIIEQANNGKINLPKPTVGIGMDRYRSIDKIECGYVDGEIRTAICGDRGMGAFNISRTNLLPIQILGLCKKVGWQMPSVSCIFTYGDGNECVVDPAIIWAVGKTDGARERCTVIKLKDAINGSFYRHVNESVSVVNNMINACIENNGEK
jgi:hypothetical protein